MKHKTWGILSVLTLTVALIAAVPVGAQGIELECAPGAVITNGVELILNLRPGSYRVTALGIDGFDPVMAVSDEDGIVGCIDDEPAASDYSADLPTTGEIDSSSLTAQIAFEYTGSDFRDFAVTVGGLGGANGEFLIIVEDMAVTSADGSGDVAGDPFTLHITPNMVAGSDSITVYMIGTESSLDPYLRLIDDENEQIISDDGEQVLCDDAGTFLCWGDSTSLSGSTIVIGDGEFEADNFDASMTLSWELLGVDETDDGFLNWRMTSFGQSSSGTYVAAFHIAVGEVGSGSSGGKTLGGGSDTSSEAAELTCTISGQAIEGDTGASLLVSCPANCNSGVIWGTDIYTDDSSICLAAQHAGVIGLEGGVFFVTIEDGQDSYPSSTQNGITSSEWGIWSRSFTVSSAQ
jgi:hypothetical protein